MLHQNCSKWCSSLTMAGSWMGRWELCCVVPNHTVRIMTVLTVCRMLLTDCAMTVDNWFFLTYYCYNQPCFLTKHVQTIFMQDIISHKVLSTWLWPAGTSLAAVCKSCPNLCSVRHQQFCFACTDNSIQRVSCSTASGDQHRH